MADYTYWLNALKGEFGPVHDSDAQPGYWRKRVSSGGAFLPVAIWEQDGKLIALLDDRTEVDAGEMWTFVCRYPVTEEAYNERIRTGKWPDEDEAMAASLKPPPASQAIGANNPPTDPWQILHEQIEIALKGVQEYGQITTDEAAAKAQGLRSRLLELSGDADKNRTALKAPHLAAGKKIDSTWNPLVNDAKTGADSLRAAISAHETRQHQARLKAEQDARDAEVERNRLAALNASPVSGPDAVLPVQPPPPPPPPEPVKTTVRGAYGRAASKKLVKKAKITDYDKAVVAMKDHPEMKDLVTKLAQRAVDAGVKVDGVEFEEVMDVR